MNDRADTPSETKTLREAIASTLFRSLSSHGSAPRKATDLRLVADDVIAALAATGPETPERPPASDDEPLSVRDVYMFEAGVDEGKRLAAATGPEMPEGWPDLTGPYGDGFRDGHAAGSAEVIAAQRLDATGPETRRGQRDAPHAGRRSPCRGSRLDRRPGGMAEASRRCRQSGVHVRRPGACAVSGPETDLPRRADALLFGGIVIDAAIERGTYEAVEPAVQAALSLLAKSASSDTDADELLALIESRSVSPSREADR